MSHMTFYFREAEMENAMGIGTYPDCLNLAQPYLVHVGGSCAVWEGGGGF